MASLTAYHLLKIIEGEAGRYDDVVRFIELCLFDSLIGNNDRYGRNLGLIRDANGTTLAPFYDNPCYLAIEIPELLGAYHEPRGAIATLETNEPVMKDYVKEWVRLGFKEEMVSFAKRVNLQTIERLITLSPLSTLRKNAIFRLIQRRYQEMCHAI
ncbi:MAG: type II toxin-antitoxin system HipA family toxin [Chlamydiae bacterium]|nr:type II toxin-antitoxin system HipA family toxin [Chlamydiota bacterium]